MAECGSYERSLQEQSSKLQNGVCKPNHMSIEHMAIY
jgi:hypothetical protein